ncbi:helix-turn-helix domain-containing protein [Desulfovibrio sp. OttesenSCG-928-G11]|nr:helix-turn-helix domain-containing protein [Desulfovibrio sp. OttesenSCG-928-G11]
MSERKLNWRQACTILGCGKTKFYEMIRMGLLPATKVGKRGVRIREADALALVEKVQPDSGPDENKM